MLFLLLLVASVLLFRGELAFRCVSFRARIYAIICVCRNGRLAVLIAVLGRMQISFRDGRRSGAGG